MLTKDPYPRGHAYIYGSPFPSPITLNQKQAAATAAAAEARSCSTAMGEGTRRAVQVSPELSFSSDSSSSSASCLSDLSDGDDASSPAPATEAPADRTERRGLSRFYNGKAQSFQCLWDVRSVEDLPKKVIPFNRKIMKGSRSCEGGFGGCNRPSPYTPRKGPVAAMGGGLNKLPLPAQKHAA